MTVKIREVGLTDRIHYSFWDLASSELVLAPLQAL